VATTTGLGRRRLPEAGRPASKGTWTVATTEDRDRALGFIGVGHMGKHMAASLIRGGFQVTICDARPEAREEPVLAGASWVDSPREVAERSRTTITSLPGPPEVEQVAVGPQGLIEGWQAGDIYIDMSTSTPTCIRAIGERAAQLGVGVLDAPVAGGMRGARRGSLTIMCGGTRADFDASRDVLAAMGEKIFLVGDLGAGHVAKLVNNMMTVANGLVAMEAMVVGAKAGVDVETLIEVVQAGTGASYSLNVFPYVIFKRNFDPAKFATFLAAKDLRISQEYAASLGVPLRIIPAAYAALQEASENGLAHRDWSSYITVLEEAAGVTVEARNGSAHD
jgi:3-hydroxyisobutyrate dehydrogenase-like beta-hydroxyacid dehydrogenase